VVVVGLTLLLTKRKSQEGREEFEDEISQEDVWKQYF
jgi:hypothetical protein